MIIAVESHDNRSWYDKHENAKIVAKTSKKASMRSTSKSVKAKHPEELSVAAAASKPIRNVQDLALTEGERTA